MLAEASKYCALDSVTRVLARELGPRKIRVNRILPGVTETEGAMQLEGFGDPAKDLVARTSLGRGGRPEDIAPAVVFRASADSGWLTGESIRVSGGVQ